MKFITAAALAVAFATPASAFDNADCKAFLTGSWTIETERDGAKISAASSYKEDGTFTQTLNIVGPNSPPQQMSRAGTWDAGPGSNPGTCLAKISPAGEAPTSVELTVVDENTVTNPDGLASHRVTQ
jgi:hypothetical protein